MYDNYQKSESSTSWKQGLMIGTIGAGLAILSFFLPWVSIDVWLTKLRVSGWTLAGEASVLILVFLLAVAVLVIAFLAYRRESLTQLEGYGFIALGALGFLILVISFGRVRSQMASIGDLGAGFFDLEELKGLVKTGLGLWTAIIGFIGVIIGGVLNLKNQS